MTTKQTAVDLRKIQAAASYLAKWFVEWLLPISVAVGFTAAVLAAAVGFQRDLNALQNTVHSRSYVGKVVKFESFPSNWDGGRMEIETDGGYFIAHGVMELLKSEPFVHEVRANGDALLCQGEPKRCLHVSRSGVR